MGFALYDLHIPCTKTTSSLLFLERDAVSEAKQIQTACINCGRCVSVCPGHVFRPALQLLQNTAIWQASKNGWYGMLRVRLLQLHLSGQTTSDSEY